MTPTSSCSPCLTPVIGLVLLTLVLSGCMVGPSVRNYAPARTVTGVFTTVQTSDATYDGELLAVTPDGLLLASPEITLIGYAGIRLVQSGADVRIRPDGALREADREALRRLSRYSLGVSESMMTALLAQHGQRELIVR
jgi:hypothetical protein